MSTLNGEKNFVAFFSPPSLMIKRSSWNSRTGRVRASKSAGGPGKLDSRTIVKPRSSQLNGRTKPNTKCGTGRTWSLPSHSMSQFTDEPDIDSRIELSLRGLLPETTRTSSLKRLLAFYSQGYSLPYIARYKRNAISDIPETSLRLVDRNYHSLQKLETERAKAIIRVQESVDVDMVTSAIVNQLELATSKAEIRMIVDSLSTPDTSSKTSQLQAALSDEIAVQLSSSVLGCLSNRCLHLADTPKDLRGKTSLVIGSSIVSDTDLVNLVRNILDRNHRGELDTIRSHTWMALKREGRATSSMFIISNPEMTEILTAIHRALVPPSCETQAISGKFTLSETCCLKFFLESAQRGLEDHIIPSIKSEWFQYVSRRAEHDAVEYFRKNLRQKLLQPPPPMIQSYPVILGIDPGLASGCKAVLLENDKVVKHFKFNPLPGSRVNVESFRDQLSGFVGRPMLVAIGNGTGSVECQQFIASIDPNVYVAIVDESGASYYSVSELAMKELPHLSVEYRGAVSIARRLCDPLSEYVKIEPQRLSVGMYQHDIKEKKLEQFLNDIVCECIADVGVDINTASESLLRFVPGLNRKTAKAIVDFRESQGIRNRMDLRKIHGIGPITFEQCVGFLQVKNSDLSPLDSTAVHPDDYFLANQVIGNHPELSQYLSRNFQRTHHVHIDPDEEARILQLLRLSDPRELYEPVEVRTASEWVGSMGKLEIKEGIVFDGVVRNITSFGAFVQLIGTTAKDDGLLHISNYPMGVQDPHYYKINQSIKVKILSIEEQAGDNAKRRKVRIALTSRL